MANTDIFNQDIRTLLKLPLRLPLKQKVNFFRVLTSLLQSGITLLAALRLAKTKVSNQVLNQIIDRMLVDVAAGSPLSRGLRLYPTIFSEEEVGLVEAGEKTGTLDIACLRILETLEKKLELQSKVVSTLMYPVIILLLLIVVFSIVVVYVLPTIAQIFINQGVALPFALGLMLGIVNFVSNYWYIVLAVLVLAGYGIWMALQKRSRRMQLERLLLKMPFYGGIIRRSTLTGLALTFSTLMEAGIPVMQSLEILARSQRLLPYKEMMEEMKQKVLDGSSISKSLSEDPSLIPVDFRELLAIGEQTASMQEMLKKIAKQYTFELEIELKNFTTLLEPLTLVFVAIMIGFFAFSVLGSIFDLLSSFTS